MMVNPTVSLNGDDISNQTVKWLRKNESRPIDKLHFFANKDST